MGDGRVIAGDLPAVVHSGVEKAIGMQHSAVANYVARLRRLRPSATPADIIGALEKRYLAAVTGAGAAMGGAAAVPGAGTGLALALSAGETAVFLETTALFTLAVAEVHAQRVEDVQRRRDVVLTVVLGDGGSMLLKEVTDRASGEQWGKLLTDLVPMSSVSAINKALCHWFMNQYPRNRGMMLLGKILPFGIGAGVGAAGNHAFGRMVVSASRRVFGPPPASFADDAVTIVDTPRDALDAVVPSPRTEVQDQPAAPEQRISPEPKPGASHTSTPGKQSGTEPTPTPEPDAVPEKRSAKRQDAPVTGKYRALFDYLVAQRTDQVILAVADIDALVPGGLPKSASTTTWWANAASSRQAKAWLAAGFTVTHADLEAQQVHFGRHHSA